MQKKKIENISSIHEENRNSKMKLEGKHLIKDTLFVNAVIYSIFAVQYFFIPLFTGLMLLDKIILTFVLGLLAILSVVGGHYYKLLPVSVLLNSLLLLIGIALFSYMMVFFSGPFNKLVFTLSIIMVFLNGVSFIVNIRGHWKGNFGNGTILFLILAGTAAYLIFVYGTLLEILIAILLLGSFLVFLQTQIPILKKHRFNLYKMLNTEFFQGGQIRVKTLSKLTLLAVIISGVSILGIGTFYGWNYTFKIKAPDDFQTVSSYWGPPSLNITTVNSNVSVTNLNRIELSNNTLDIDPDYFRNGSLAYILNVSEGGKEKNYANYSIGAQSYPNGTIILSEPLPAVHGDVNVTFKYVLNNKLLEDLNISQSTLIMNYHGDFIYNDNVFAWINRTYLFQLLDYWEIKFYLDISNGIEFPHVFNYQNSVPIGYTTLYWADGKWDMFQGISYDFEPGGHAVAPGDPGGTNFTIGDLFGYTEQWARTRRSWYHSNEQNRTLFAEATAAYEELYAEVSSLGYKSYVVTGKGELLDSIDGDIDYTRCPFDPLSKNPDVLFGHMCYQDNNEDEGRYCVYRDSYEQIALLGDRGRSILLGWLAVGTDYYTDDETGLDRYIQDCKIAQAAGMNEIFHAPIYRMQKKWGDDAVLELHEALNDDPKGEITIDYPGFEMNESMLYDMVENLNYWWLFLPVVSIIIIRIGIFGTGDLRRLLKAKKT
ncbi:MAG: hypothetical protein GF364_20785 [Candidatus Lokiarchaeota archaeon]|nr:hypothetical protein [Candidatus Lokiarchaeota archaeon]